MIVPRRFAVAVVLAFSWSGLVTGCTDRVRETAVDAVSTDVVDVCSGVFDCPDNDGDAYYVMGLCCPTPPLPVDCDDNDALSYPGGLEICGDGHDNDCDDVIDNPLLCDTCEPGCELGEAACSGPNRISHCEAVDGCPRFASPIPCPDGQGCRDNACIPVCLDRDGDGYSEDCGERDCDDTRSNVYPGAPELCDGHDNNCDRRTDENFVCDEDCDDECSRDEITCTPDGAGFVTCELASNDCWFETGRVLCPNGGFCADGACGVEPVCQDFDYDGYGPACEGSGDCRPTEGEVHPGADEICDGRDNDCDSAVDEGNVCGACTPSTLEAPLSASWGAPHYRVSCDSREFVRLGAVNVGDRVSIAVGGGVGLTDVELGRHVGSELRPVSDPFLVGESVVLLYEATAAEELILRVESVPGTSLTVVAALEASPFHCAADAFEPNNTPAVGAPVGAAPFGVTGTVCEPDRDFFNLPGHTGRVLSASLAHEGGNGRDLSVSIYRNGALLSPGFSGPTGTSGFPDGHHAFARMDLPGEYSVEVRDLAHDPSNDYALVIQALDLPACEDDAGEMSSGWDDDTIATAQDLAPNSPVSATLCPGDYDIYRVGNLSAGSHLTAELSHDSGINLDARMLRDGWIGLVQEGHTDGSTERFDNGISADGVYYFAVYGRTAQDAGAYRFSYSR